MSAFVEEPSTKLCRPFFKGKTMFKPFSVTKVIQASAILLKASDTSRISWLRLLKLLYIADRDSIQQTGQSITEDCYVAMDQGRFRAIHTT